MPKDNLPKEIKNRPPEGLNKSDLVDFPAQADDYRLVATAMRVSEQAFACVGDNEEDAAYDRL
jgi:hypothetical protein